MTSLLIAIHVIAAILLIGPVTVAVSSYQGQMLAAHNGEASALGSARTLHGITTNYGYISAIVPVVGIAVFLTDLSTYGKQGQFHASILLAIIAWALLFFLIIPRQKASLDALGSEQAGAATEFDFAKAKKQLSMYGGIFSLLWVIVAVLMFI